MQTPFFVRFHELFPASDPRKHLSHIGNELPFGAGAARTAEQIAVGIEDEECRHRPNVVLARNGTPRFAVDVDLKSDEVVVHKIADGLFGEDLRVHILTRSAPLGIKVDEYRQPAVERLITSGLRIGGKTYLGR